MQTIVSGVQSEKILYYTSCCEQGCKALAPDGRSSRNLHMDGGIRGTGKPPLSGW